MLHYNKEQLAIIHKEKLAELIEFAGGATFLSRMLGVPLTTIKGWMDRGRISKKGTLLVEKNASLKEVFNTKYLRPDLIK